MKLCFPKAKNVGEDKNIQLVHMRKATGSVTFGPWKIQRALKVISKKFFKNILLIDTSYV